MGYDSRPWPTHAQVLHQPQHQLEHIQDHILLQHRFERNELDLQEERFLNLPMMVSSMMVVLLVAPTRDLPMMVSPMMVVLLIELTRVKGYT